MHTFRSRRPLATAHAVLLALLALAPAPAAARKITVRNSCQSTVWAGMHTGLANTAPSHSTGWEMARGAVELVEVPETWTAGRIWARTGCVITPDRMFQCLTGACGLGPVGAGLEGSVECGLTNQPPSTLAEFTLVPGDEDWYDVSLVDGFNIPMEIIPSTDCARPMCETNINPMCPPLLRTGIDTSGRNLGCIHACNAGFGQEMYGNRACCSGGYNEPELCAVCGVDYYSLFKDNCRTSYAYAYDEKSGTALYRCPAPASSPPNYEVIFCPNGTDYVGAVTPQGNYLSATATCSNMVTAGIETFSVPPSPTLLQTNILPIKATAGTMLDGAAAFQTTSIGGNVATTATGTGASATPTTVGSPGGHYAIVGTETFDIPSPTPSANTVVSGGGQDRPAIMTMTVTSVVVVEAAEQSASNSTSGGGLPTPSESTAVVTGGTPQGHGGQYLTIV